MVWIDATSVATQVIQDLAIWYFTLRSLVYDAVRSQGFRVLLNNSVAGIPKPPRPVPAGRVQCGLTHVPPPSPPVLRGGCAVPAALLVLAQERRVYGARNRLVRQLWRHQGRPCRPLYCNR